MSWAFITGASSGIGRELSIEFAKNGKNLLIHGRDREKLGKLEEIIKTKGVEVETVVFDLKDKNFENIISPHLESKRIEVLVNNAGFGNMGEFINLPLEKELEMIEVNIEAILILTRLFIDYWTNKKIKGILINISSVCAFYPVPRMATYCGTKAFVYSFSESLRWELKDRGIKVLTVCPGVTRTEFHRRAGYENPAFYKFWGTNPEDVAKKVVEFMDKDISPLFTDFYGKMSYFFRRLLPHKIFMELEDKLTRKFIR